MNHLPARHGLGSSRATTGKPRTWGESSRVPSTEIRSERFEFVESYPAS
jgi:hypothetical protein